MAALDRVCHAIQIYAPDDWRVRIFYGAKLQSLQNERHDSDSELAPPDSRTHSQYASKKTKKSREGAKAVPTKSKKDTEERLSKLRATVRRNRDYAFNSLGTHPYVVLCSLDDKAGIYKLMTALYNDDFRTKAMSEGIHSESIIAAGFSESEAQDLLSLSPHKDLKRLFQITDKNVATAGHNQALGVDAYQSHLAGSKKRKRIATDDLEEAKRSKIEVPQPRPHASNTLEAVAETTGQEGEMEVEEGQKEVKDEDHDSASAAYIKLEPESDDEIAV